MSPFLKITVQMILYLLTICLLLWIIIILNNDFLNTKNLKLLNSILFCIILLSFLSFITLNNSQLFKKYSKNNRIYEEDIILINKLNQSINHGEDFIGILKLFTKETKKIFNCKYITVFLLNKDQSRLILNKESIMPQGVISDIETLTAIRIPDNISIDLNKSVFYKKLIKNGTPVITNDPEELYNRMSDYDDFTNRGILNSIIPIVYKFLNLKASLSIPLASKNTPLGLINIYRNSNFTKNDLKRFEIISQSLVLMLNRRLIEDKLAETLNKYSNLIYNTMDIIFSLDSKGKITFYNKSLEKLLGVDEVELIGLNIIKLIPKNKKSKFENYISENYQGKTVKGESIFIDKFFKEHYFKFNSVPLYRDNEVIGMQAIATDITENRLNEIALQQSENHYKSIVEDQTDLICRLMPDKTIVYANEAYCHYFKKNKDDIIGTKYLSGNIIKKEDKEIIDEVFLNINFKNQSASLEHKIIFSKNKIKWQKWSYRGVFNINKKLTEYQVVGYDITERKKAENEINRLNNILIEKNKYLEKIIFIASHDLKSPLVNIHGFSKEISYSLNDILKNYDQINLNKKLKDNIVKIINNDIPDSLKYIEKSIFKMDNLLSGLLIISKIDKNFSKNENINIENLLNEILLKFEVITKDKNIAIDIKKIPNCIGDKKLISQVFSNLIDNAIKYKDPKKDLKIKISGHNKDNHVVFCIEDNGIGISKENQKKIFEIFHRINPENTIGEGLGLNIVSKIINMHNGIIWVESKENKGSKFYFSLQNI